MFLCGIWKQAGSLQAVATVQLFSAFQNGRAIDSWEEENRSQRRKPIICVPCLFWPPESGDNGPMSDSDRG